MPRSNKQFDSKVNDIPTLLGGLDVQVRSPCRLAARCESGYSVGEGPGPVSDRCSKPPEACVMKIFISYRRDDTQHSAGRLYERLVRVFGRNNVFKDVDSIPPGADFRDLLVQRVSDASVMLAVIGANWQSRDDQNRSRLENSGDFVRIELENAMQRNIPDRGDEQFALFEAGLFSGIDKSRWLR